MSFLGDRYAGQGRVPYGISRIPVAPGCGKNGYFTKKLYHILPELSRHNRHGTTPAGNRKKETLRPRQDVKIMCAGLTRHRFHDKMGRKNIPAPSACRGTAKGVTRPPDAASVARTVCHVPGVFGSVRRIPKSAALRQPGTRKGCRLPFCIFGRPPVGIVPPKGKDEI